MDQTERVSDSYASLARQVNRDTPRTRQVVTIYTPTLAPKLWRVWLQGFGASPGLAQRLWRTLLTHRAGDELGLVIRAQRRCNPASVGAMLQALSPGRMVALCALLAPEGQPREPQVLALEQQILAAARSPDAWR